MKIQHPTTFDLEQLFSASPKPYSVITSDLLTNQKRFESKARTYPRKLPLAITKVDGIYIQDANGNVYIDCLCGAGSLALGHNHPAVIEAIKTAIDSNSPLLTLDFTTPIKDKFVYDLFDALPKKFAEHAKIQFCSPSGADGIEAAIKLVKTVTGKKTILSFCGSYHGMTMGALSVTGMIEPKAGIAGYVSDVVFLPFPYNYRCPLGIGGEDGEQAILNFIETILGDPFSGISSVAGLLIEVVQGEGGVIPASDTWLRAIRAITKKYNIPMIVDEVQTGIGRTGNMFAFEQAGIIPDVVVISKSIGGGLPLSVIVYDEALDIWKTGAHVGTFRGNQLAMAAGSAVLRVIQERHIIENVNHIGNHMRAKLEYLKKKFHVIGEIRGRGLMLAAEIVNPKEAPDQLGSFPTFGEFATKVQQECFKRGLIIELGGRNDSVVRFLPPLNITKELADIILYIFEQSLDYLYENFL